MNIEAATAWKRRRRLVVRSVYYTLKANRRKWLSFFHVIGQARLSCEETEAAIANCDLFNRKTDRNGLLWLSLNPEGRPV